MKSLSMVITISCSQYLLPKTQENITLSVLSGRLNVGTEEKGDIREGLRGAFPKELCVAKMLVDVTQTHTQGGVSSMSLHFIRISRALNANVHCNSKKVMVCRVSKLIQSSITELQSYIVLTENSRAKLPRNCAH